MSTEFILNSLYLYRLHVLVKIIFLYLYISISIHLFFLISSNYLSPISNTSKTIFICIVHLSFVSFTFRSYPFFLHSFRCKSSFYTVLNLFVANRYLFKSVHKLICAFFSSAFDIFFCVCLWQLVVEL